MTEWGTRTRTFQGDDKSWLASAIGVDAGLPAELDLSLFDTVTAYPNGFIPSGVVLARRASDRLVGPYDPGTTPDVNETQTITVTGTPTGGSFTLSFGGDTATIPYNATAAQALALLEGLSVFDSGDVAVTGGALPGTPLVVEFRGQYADRNVAMMTVNNAGLTGGSSPAAAVTQSVQGGNTGAATGGAGLDVALGLLLFPVSTVDSFGVQRTTGVSTASYTTRGRVFVPKLPTNNMLDAQARDALPLIEFLDNL